LKHLNIKVIGRVQGVGFRYSALHMARNLNLKGFVRNNPDGSVYIEAEGDEENLNIFTDWCRNSPGGSRVDRALITEGPMRNFEDFSVNFF